MGIPYIAGLYALACQVDKNVTPEVFWKVALETGDIRIIEKDGEKLTGKIINPRELINMIRNR